MNNENIYDVKLLIGVDGCRHCLIFSYRPVAVGDQFFIDDLVLGPFSHQISILVETVQLPDGNYRSECYARQNFN